MVSLRIFPMNGWPKAMAPLVNLRTSKSTAQIFCCFGACRDLRVGRRENIFALSEAGGDLTVSAEFKRSLAKRPTASGLLLRFPAAGCTLSGAQTVGSIH